MRDVTFDREREADLRHVYGYILALALRKGLGADAEDVAQETMIAVLRGHAGYVETPGKTYRMWLLGVAWKCLARGLRRRSRQRRLEARCNVESESVPTPHDTPETLVSVEQARDRRQALLLLIPLEDQVVFRVWAEQYHREITGEDACRLLRMTMDEYEARKQRVRRSLKAATKRLGLDVKDLTPTLLLHARAIQTVEEG